MNRTALTMPNAQHGVPAAASPGVGQARSRLEKANLDFDSVVLKSFVEAMLPKHATSVYGRGTAGDIWRSYLAEHIANELGHSGKIKILGAGR